MSEERSKILVTGGAGFIGSNICDALINNGYEVVCLDNFSTGKPENLYDLVKSPHFKLIVGDIREISDCRKAIKEVKAIFHHAALGSETRSITDPLTTNAINVNGFLNILVAAKEEGVKRIVYAASSFTDDDINSVPLKANGCMMKAESPYVVSKYADELYGHAFNTCYGMQTIGLRYFNVYGPKQDILGPNIDIISKLFTKLMKGEIPNLKNIKSIYEDYIYVSDVVAANLLALNTKTPESLDEIYNIASGQTKSLEEVIQIIKDIIRPYYPEIDEIPIEMECEDNNQIRSNVSIEKAKRLLNFSPQFDLINGLTDTFKWLETNK